MTASFVLTYDSLVSTIEQYLERNDASVVQQIPVFITLAEFEIAQQIMRRNAMRTRTTQKGMTFWGLLMVFALIVFFTVLTLKLMPPYMEYGKVKTALENVARQPDAGSMERADIKNALDRRFSIEDVNNVNLDKNLFVEKKPGVTIIRIAYERRVPMAYNITALIEFDHSVQVNAR